MFLILTFDIVFFCCCLSRLLFICCFDTSSKGYSSPVKDYVKSVIIKSTKMNTNVHYIMLSMKSRKFVGC